MSAEWISGFAVGITFTSALYWVVIPWLSQKMSAYGRSHGWR